jgi:hypothetical protein
MKIKVILILMIVYGGGCDLESINIECHEKKNLAFTLTNQKARVVRYYDEWAIYPVTESAPGAPVAIDGNKILFPCHLDATWKQNGLELIISGNAFETDYSPEVQVGGDQFFVFELTKIEVIAEY